MIEEPGGHPAFDGQAFTGVKLGRLARRDDPRTLRLARYLDPAKLLPKAPDACDWTPGIRFPMYGNDVLGNCTVAAAAHMIQVWKHATGRVGQPTRPAVDRAYWETGDHQDTGRVELDVLNYWRHYGIGVSRILAYAAVDPADETEMRTAIWLFGGVYTGLDLPLTAQRQTVWDTVPSAPHGQRAPGSWGGHAVPYNAYTPAGYTCVTWGATVKLTGRFHRAYCDEAYAIVSGDWLRTVDRRTVHGFNLDALRADLAAL